MQKLRMIVITAVTILVIACCLLLESLEYRPEPTPTPSVTSTYAPTSTFAPPVPTKTPRMPTGSPTASATPTVGITETKTPTASLTASPVATQTPTPAWSHNIRREMPNGFEHRQPKKTPVPCPECAPRSTPTP